MSNVKLAGNVSGTGSVTIASPNTNSDISISLPTVTGGSFIVSDSSGNVGIGTSSPDFRLTLQSGGDVQMSFKDSGGTTRAYIGTAGAFGTAPTGALRIRSDQGGIVFGISGAETARLDTSGNFQFNSGYGSVATAYGCRAWVNFNGSGTVAIRASGNVSSITDNGTGNYTVNFTTSMPDTNYCPVFGAEGGFDVQRYQTNGTQNTGNYQVYTGYQTTGGALVQADIGTVLVAIFR